MPLTGSDSALSAALRSAFLASASNAVDNEALTALCDVLAATVIAHFVANAQVVPTALVAPGGGGPVTGTGTLA